MTGNEIDRLQNFYVPREPAVVQNFLYENPVSAQMLKRAVPRIRKFFGKDVAVTVDVLEDPDSANKRNLYVEIYTSEELQVALDRLSQFDAEVHYPPLTSQHTRVVFNIRTNGD